MTTTNKLYEKVSVHLTDAQLIDLGQELAEKEVAYNDLVSEKSEALGTFNAKLKTLESEIADLAAQVNDRKKETDIEVRLEPDDGRNLIAIVRVDNGQVLKTRPMTLNEMAEAKKRLQGDLFDGDPEETPNDTDRPTPHENQKVTRLEPGRKKKGRKGAVAAAPEPEETEEPSDEAPDSEREPAEDIDEAEAAEASE